MSPIPSEPLKPAAQELKTKDGRTFRLKLPGVEPPPQPEPDEAQAAPRDDRRPPVDPDQSGA